MVAEDRGLATQSDRGFRHGGEVDVGGDVHFAGGSQRVFGGAVLGKGAEGAGFAVGVVVFGPREAVVGPQQEAGTKASGERFEEIGKVGANFGAVAIGEVVA